MATAGEQTLRPAPSIPLSLTNARGDSSGPKTSGEAGTDVWALRQGAIAVTPLRAVVAEAIEGALNVALIFDIR